MNIASDREFYDAVITSLEAAGLTVGDAVAPDSHSGFYAIVYPMPSGGTFGPSGAQHDDESHVVQVTSVGTTRVQAQWVADKAKVRMLSGLVTIPGRVLMGLPSMDVGTGVSRDDDTAAAPIFYAIHRYRFLSTPA